eukprot:1031287_1
MASTQFIVHVVIFILFHGASLSARTDSIGIIDILDDIHVQFDLIVTTSYPTDTYSNIIHIGSQSYIALQTTPMGLLSLLVSFHQSNQSHCAFEHKPIPLNTWHHLEFHATQDKLLALFNGARIYNKTTHNSHQTAWKQPVFINNNLKHVLWKKMQIKSNNAHIIDMYTSNTRHLLHQFPIPPQPRAPRTLFCGDTLVGPYNGVPITFTLHVSSVMHFLFDASDSKFTLTGIQLYTGGSLLVSDLDDDGIIYLEMIAIGDYNFVMYGNDQSAPTYSPSASTTFAQDSDSEGGMVLDQSTLIMLISFGTLCLCLCCFCFVCCKSIHTKKKKEYMRSMTMVRFEQKQDIAEEYLSIKVLEEQAANVAAVDTWLTNECMLPQYVSNFINNGFDSMDIIKQIEKPIELESIGIKRTAHNVIILGQIRLLTKKEKSNHAPNHAQQHVQLLQKEPEVQVVQLQKANPVRNVKHDEAIARQFNQLDKFTPGRPQDQQQHAQLLQKKPKVEVVQLQMANPVVRKVKESKQLNHDEAIARQVNRWDQCKTGQLTPGRAQDPQQPKEVVRLQMADPVVRNSKKSKQLNHDETMAKQVNRWDQLTPGNPDRQEYHVAPLNVGHKYLQPVGKVREVSHVALQIEDHGQYSANDELLQPKPKMKYQTKGQQTKGKTKGQYQTIDYL